MIGRLKVNNHGHIRVILDFLLVKHVGVPVRGYWITIERCDWSGIFDIKSYNWYYTNLWWSMANCTGNTSGSILLFQKITSISEWSPKHWIWYFLVTLKHWICHFLVHSGTLDLLFLSQKYWIWYFLVLPETLDLPFRAPWNGGFAISSSLRNGNQKS